MQLTFLRNEPKADKITVVHFIHLLCWTIKLPQFANVSMLQKSLDRTLIKDKDITVTHLKQ